MNFFRKISGKSLFFAMFFMVGVLLAPLFSPGACSSPILSETSVSQSSSASPWLVRVVRNACNAGELVQILNTLRVRNLAALQKHANSKDSHASGFAPLFALALAAFVGYCIVYALSRIYFTKRSSSRNFLSQIFGRINPVRAGPLC